MHGAASRDNVRLKKHSFRLIFNPEFDGPGRLEFPLFDDSDFADINTVVLKAGFTDSFATRTVTGRYSPLDSTYTRDVSMLDSQRAMGSLVAECDVRASLHQRPVLGTVLLRRSGRTMRIWRRTSAATKKTGMSSRTSTSCSAATRMPGTPCSRWSTSCRERPTRKPTRSISSCKAAIRTARSMPALPVYLDMDNLIDYMILHLYAGVEDWPSHNWIAARNRVNPGTGFQFFTWDQEIAWDGRFRDRTESAADTGYSNTPGRALRSPATREPGVPPAVRRPRAEAHVQRRRADGRRHARALAGSRRPDRGGDHRRIGPLGRRPRRRSRQRAAHNHCSPA